MFVGVNVTLIVQLALAASDVPQLLVCAKSVMFVPDMAMLEMVRALAVPFVKVTGCAALVVLSTCSGKVTDAGATETEFDPVPVSATVCGLAPALSVSDRLPVRVPVAVGVNVMENVQLAFGPSDVPQLLV